MISCHSNHHWGHPNYDACCLGHLLSREVWYKISNKEYFMSKTWRSDTEYENSVNLAWFGFQDKLILTPFSYAAWAKEHPNWEIQAQKSACAYWLEETLVICLIYFRSWEVRTCRNKYKSTHKCVSLKANGRRYLVQSQNFCKNLWSPIGLGSTGKSTGFGFVWFWANQTEISCWNLTPLFFSALLFNLTRIHSCKISKYIYIYIYHQTVCLWLFLSACLPSVVAVTNASRLRNTVCGLVTCYFL